MSFPKRLPNFDSTHRLPHIMRALVFDGDLHVDDVQVPVPGPGEALIHVRHAGICGTDLEIIRGYKGFRGIPGHEFVGEVVASPTDTWVGKRVCGEINIGCGRCPECSSGLTTHCRNRRVLGILDYQGAFAEYLTLPLGNLHMVPAEVSDDEAVFVEPLAAAFEILEQIRVRSADRVLILGDGRLGLLCAQVLALTEGRVTLLGRHPEKMALVAGRGIDTVTSREDLGERFDIVVDATGTTSGLASAMELVRPRGTLVLKSTTAEAGRIDMSPAVVNEITIVGSRCGPFGPAMAALRRGEIAVTEMIWARFPLADGVTALQRAGEPGTLKVLLDMIDPIPSSETRQEVRDADVE